MKRDLERISKDTFDLLVVGGGIYGAWAAWDATLRGHSVALLEQSDFGGATSANSLKIIHGGLRYLQTLDLRRMRESIRERTVLLRVAPELVHPLPCVVPTGPGLRRPAAFRAALAANDLMGFDRNRGLGSERQLPRGRIISASEMRDLFPFLHVADSRSGALWYDAQVQDSERLTLSVLLAAADRGAALANYAGVQHVLVEDDAVSGVRAVDQCTGRTFEVRSRTVLDATGPWVDTLARRLPGAQPARAGAGPELAEAINLVVRSPPLGAALGLQASHVDDSDPGGSGGRFLFLVPWRNRTLIGTWYPRCKPRPEPGMELAAHTLEETDLRDLVDRCNRACPELELSLGDVTWYHRGYLPLDRVAEPGAMKNLARRGRVTSYSDSHGIDGLFAVEGVKYTTARLLAERAVDAVQRASGWATVPSRTAEVRLKAARTPPGGGSGEASYNGSGPIAEGVEVTRHEVLHAIREEMALELTDVVLRRTGMGSQGPPQPEALAAVAELCASELGWDENRREREIRAVRESYAPLPGR